LSDINEQTTTFPLKVVSSIIISSFFGGRIISRLATSNERPLRGGRGKGEVRGKTGEEWFRRGRVVGGGGILDVHDKAALSKKTGQITKNRNELCILRVF
jgi:hypothetical protein